MPEFHRVASVAEIPDPGKILVEVDGDMVALFHVEGRFHAIDDVCTHYGGPLVDGELSGHKIACPRHGARFDIRTGAALSMPAVRATRSHSVKVENGAVWVALGTGHGPTAGSVSPRPDGLAAVTADSAEGPATSAMASSQPVSATPARSDAAAIAGPASEEVVREWLKEVKDPELFVNVVDLGLIYGVALGPADDASGRQHVTIDMTMTSPACPAGPQLIADTKRVVGGHDGIAGVEVRIVMDPPWTPDRMTEAARDQLGIF